MRLRLTVTLFAVFALSAYALSACGGGGAGGGGNKAMRFRAPIVLKVNAASAPTKQYAGGILNQRKQVGIPCEIDAVEFNVMLEQQQKGQFQITTGRWVGGNQD